MFTIQKNAAKASNTGKLSSLPKIIKGTSPKKMPQTGFTFNLFEKKLLNKKNMTLGSMGAMQKSSILSKKQ